MDIKEHIKKFSQRVNELRIEKSLSAVLFSKEAKIPLQTIYDWQHGRRIPNMESIIKICNFFGCTAGYLIGLED